MSINVNELKSRLGTAIFLLVIAWLVFNSFWILQIDTAHVIANTALGTIVSILVFAIGLGITLSLVFFAYKLASRIISLKSQRWLKYVLIISLAITTDYLLAWLPVVIWFGDGGLIDTILPFFSPSTAIAWSPLKYSTRIVGIFGAGGICWAFLFLLSKSKFRAALVTLTALIFFSFTGRLLYMDSDVADSHPKLEIFVISSEEHEEKTVNIDTPYNGTRLVLFPEYGLSRTAQDLNESVRLKSGISKDDIYIAGTRQVFVDGQPGFKNQFMAGDYSNNLVSSQLKYRLVPFGEYLPALIKAPLELFVGKKMVSDQQFDHKVIAGRTPLDTFEIDNISFAPQICFGIANQSDYQAMVRDGAMVLVNPASIGIFEKSKIFHHKNRALQKILAVSNMRYFAQSTTGGHAVILDQNGRQVTAHKNGTTSVEITPISKQTIYSKHGEWMLSLSVTVLLAAAVGFVMPRILTSRYSSFLKNIVSRVRRDR